MDEKVARKRRKKPVGQATSPGPLYGLGFLGAVIYYFQHADTFWLWVLGFLKALVWPAFLIHRVFEVIKM